MACSKNKCTTKNSLSSEHRTILSTLAGLAIPSGSKDIANACGMTGQTVTCKLKSLKAKGLVESPVRCKYTVTPAGQAAIAGV